MKTLPVITFLILLPCHAFAQEIYKWEDEKGVIHYGEKPDHPAASPLKKDATPYSNTGNLPPESPAEKKARMREEREEERSSSGGHQPRPSPSLGQPKAWLDHNGRLRLAEARSGTVARGSVSRQRLKLSSSTITAASMAISLPLLSQMRLAVERKRSLKGST